MNELLRLRYFGQLVRSILLNMNNYSPKSIEQSGSNYHILATILILGQAPSWLILLLLNLIHVVGTEPEIYQLKSSL